MVDNPSMRKRKAYIILLLGFSEEGDGNYDSVSIVFVTLDKNKADDIERLWEIVQKNRHEDCWEHPEKGKSNIALKELKDKYGIIAWSGEELRVEEEEVK